MSNKKNNQMKIVIAGGTGLIGSYLLTKFSERGDDVHVISRHPGHVSWSHDDLVNGLEGADILINLAGRSINCRHNKVNRELILKSRIETTEKLGKAVEKCCVPPKLWVNASASAIYSPDIKVPASESSTQFADDFLSFVVREWENAFFGFHLPKTRQLALRTAVVLSNDGGAFVPLYWLTKFGLGGKQGSGKQHFSWIHIEDYYRMIIFLMNNELSGIINCTSPNPVTNSELMRTLRRSTGMRIGLPAPDFAIGIGAVIIGTEKSLLLNSSYLYPEIILNAGFQFKFPNIENAIIDLINK